MKKIPNVQVGYQIKGNINQNMNLVSIFENVKPKNGWKFGLTSKNACGVSNLKEVYVKSEYGFKF